MIDLILDRCESRLDVREIHHPAQMCIHRPAYVHLDLKAVPMHARALVTPRNIRQPVRRLYAELFEYLHTLFLPNPQELVRLQA